MTKYQNLSGDSGVDSFEVRPNGIIVRFVDKTEYLYTYIRPGRYQVDKMKSLASAGKGLSTYINQEIKRNYETKIR